MMATAVEEGDRFVQNIGRGDQRGEVGKEESPMSQRPRVILVVSRFERDEVARIDEECAHYFEA
jgi:hypothetical protein